MSVRMVFVLVLSLALILLVAQNTAPVPARFLWFTAELPTVLLLFLAAAGGFVLGLLVPLLGRARSRTRNKRSGT